MKPHLELAKSHWKNHLKPDATVIDATCGRGKDTLALLELVPEGQIIALDIQEEALKSCKEIILSSRVTFLLQSHVTLPSLPGVSLIVYNLGYLPGGDHQVTTLTSTTLQSVHQATTLLAPGGALSIMCYPGHPEGAREQESLLNWAETLDPTRWKKSFYTWRAKSPNFLWVKSLETTKS
jgi:16S rRNA G1207 methylase RsmC